MSSSQNREIAEAILPLVGGAGNVTSVSQCMTRMRLEVVQRSLVQDEALRALPDVMGVVEDDTYQIVLGPGKVSRVTPEFEALLAEERAAEPSGSAGSGGSDGAPAPAGGHGKTAEELAAEGEQIRAERKRRNATPVKLMLRRIANIFVPLIPALIGAGIVAGLNGVLENAGWLTGFTPALAAISQGFITLLAVFVGINTAKEFGGTPVLGGAAAAVIVFPDVSGVSAFGQELAPGQGGVLGALGAALLATFIEKQCRKWVPEAIDVLVTPTITLLITGLVTLFGLMFIAGEVSTAIGDAANWLLENGGAAAGLVLGGLFLPVVMLGLHQALIPIHTTLIGQDGYTVLLPILAMAGAGQVGAAVAIYYRLRRNSSIRKTIRSALPAGVLGVGEPLIYGVSLPLGRPFITACIGGAFGGGAIGLFYQLGTSVGSTAIGPSGWALFPLLKGDQGLAAIATVYGLGLLIGYAGGFLVTYFFGFSRQMLEELNVDPETEGTPDTALADPSAALAQDADAAGSSGARATAERPGPDGGADSPTPTEPTAGHADDDTPGPRREQGPDSGQDHPRTPVQS